MDARDFLALSRQLASATTEAAWRSAVSRAYYATFHVARLLMEDLQFAVPQADRAHAYLWLRLANCGEPGVQQAAYTMNELRGYRNRADYDLGRALRQALAQTQVQQAGRIIQILDALGKPTRGQIRDEMKKYERNVLKEITWPK
jgi:uncharacterized protein (UPF0332 family)